MQRLSLVDSIIAPEMFTLNPQNQTTKQTKSNVNNNNQIKHSAFVP